MIISSVLSFQSMAHASMTCDTTNTLIDGNSKLSFEYEPAQLYKSLRSNMKQTTFGAVSESAVKVFLHIGNRNYSA